LRKEMRPPHILCSMLDDWFDRFKCSSSDTSRPPRGRKDPLTGETLFTPETKDAIKNCKEKAKYIQDPLPLDQMYDTIKPNQNSAHQLNEHMARRGESCLESFHGMLAHFGNSGMRTTLADNLNLTGAARYNLSMRHKRRLISDSMTPENPDRKKIPSACESLVSFFNHSELACTNQLALDAGSSILPFHNVEILPPDNGERFFSEHLIWKNATNPRNDEQSRCLCDLCGQVNGQPRPQQQAVPLALADTNGQDATTKCAPPEQALAKIQELHQAVNGQPTEQVDKAPDCQQLRIVPRQQQNTHHHHHHHQQPQNHTPAVNSMRTNTNLHQQQNAMIACHSQPVAMTTPFPPWIVSTNSYPVPMLTPQTAMFCCGRHRCWHNSHNGRGRPPHSDHCQRPGKSEKNRHDDPGGLAI